MHLNSPLLASQMGLISGLLHCANAPIEHAASINVTAWFEILIKPPFGSAESPPRGAARCNLRGVELKQDAKRYSKGEFSRVKCGQSGPVHQASRQDGGLLLNGRDPISTLRKK
jgi:hypothetical protein